MMKTAIITGVLGQDGAYLAKFLLDKGYKVYGAYRRNSSANTWRLKRLGIERDVEMIPLELLEYSNIQRCIGGSSPTSSITSPLKALSVSRLSSHYSPPRWTVLLSPAFSKRFIR